MSGNTVNWNKVGSVMLAGSIPGLALGGGATFLLLPIITTTWILVLTAAGITIPSSLFFGLFFAKPQAALEAAPEVDWNENNTGQLTTDIAKMEEG